LRDALRDKWRIKAIEMEGAGVADAAWTLERDYFIVRGISDYADSNKNDLWQPYAQIVAAAYVRALLGTLPSLHVVERRANRRRRIVWSTLGILAVVLTFMFARDGLWHWPTRGSNSERPRFQVYISSKHLPVRIYCDGQVRALDQTTPFTTIDVTQGDHWVEATSSAFRCRRMATVSAEQPVATVEIPSDCRDY
jgi:hypothetical protein